MESVHANYLSLVGEMGNGIWCRAVVLKLYPEGQNDSSHLHMFEAQLARIPWAVSRQGSSVFSQHVLYYPQKMSHYWEKEKRRNYCTVCVLVAQSCLFATLWTVACHTPLSMGFSRQEYWSRLPCSPPGDLPRD